MDPFLYQILDRHYVPLIRIILINFGKYLIYILRPEKTLLNGIRLEIEGIRWLLACADVHVAVRNQNHEDLIHEVSPLSGRGRLEAVVVEVDEGLLDAAHCPGEAIPVLLVHADANTKLHALDPLACFIYLGVLLFEPSKQALRVDGLTPIFTPDPHKL